MLCYPFPYFSCQIFNLKFRNIYILNIRETDYIKYPGQKVQVKYNPEKHPDEPCCHQQQDHGLWRHAASPEPAY